MAAICCETHLVRWFHSMIHSMIESKPIGMLSGILAVSINCRYVSTSSFNSKFVVFTPITSRVQCVRCTLSWPPEPVRLGISLTCRRECLVYVHKLLFWNGVRRIVILSIMYACRCRCLESLFKGRFLFNESSWSSIIVWNRMTRLHSIFSGWIVY